MGKLFKFLNFLSKDYLRNYLAVGVGLNIENCVNYIERTSNPNSKAVLMYLKKAQKGLNDTFNL